MTTNGLEQGVMEDFPNYKHNEIRKDISKLFTTSVIINDIYHFIYKSNSGGVCLSVWAVSGRFFQSLPVPQK